MKLCNYFCIVILNVPLQFVQMQRKETSANRINKAHIVCVMYFALYLAL